jgi:hypothetical protein
MALTLKEKAQIRKVIAYKVRSPAVELVMEEMAALSDTEARAEIEQWKTSRREEACKAKNIAAEIELEIA